MHIWQARFWRRALSPYSIYRHYPVLHAVRVGLAYLLTVVLTLGFDIPHGEWMSITVLIVMGSLPHLGSIFKKARQRAIGTAAGALAGILLIALFTKVAWLGYVLLVLAAAICGYLAIGPLGYIALIAGVTLTIIAGPGSTDMHAALWRSANIFAGGIVALVFARLLPQRATNHWRYLLADNLRECASLYNRLATLDLPSPKLLQALLEPLNKRLVMQRTLFAAVLDETGFPKRDLEQIQRTQRSMIELLELLADALAHAGPQQLQAQSAIWFPATRHTLTLLRTTAHALKFDRQDRLFRVALPLPESRTPPVQATGDIHAAGFAWLNLQARRQATEISLLLRQNVGHWISRTAQPPWTVGSSGNQKP